MTATDELLVERGKTHGDFGQHAKCTQDLKRAFYGNCVNKLDDAKRESVDMILHKLGRIASGNPDHADHWADIAGYARLVEQRIETPEN